MVGLVVLLAFAAHVLPPLVRAGARWLLATILLVQAACIVTLNAWMQQPVGTRVGVNGAEIVDLQAIFLSETALCKVAHTLSAGLLTGTLFVVSVSAFYLLRRRHLAVARFSLALTLPMAGLALVATVWSGHSSGRQVMAQQPMKFAAMEAHWGEHEGPAPLTLLAVPDMSSQTNRYALAVPKLLSWLATHSEESPRGMRELVARAEQQIGAALQEPHGPEGTGWRQLYERTAQRHEAWASLTDAQRLHAAALASRPSVPTLFVSFRVMVGCAVVLGFAIAVGAADATAPLAQGGQPRGAPPAHGLPALAMARDLCGLDAGGGRAAAVDHLRADDHRPGRRRPARHGAGGGSADGLRGDLRAARDAVQPCRTLAPPARPGAPRLAGAVARARTRLRHVGDEPVRRAAPPRACLGRYRDAPLNPQTSKNTVSPSPCKRMSKRYTTAPPSPLRSSRSASSVLRRASHSMTFSTGSLAFASASSLK
jgi:hypothetical protein